MNKIITIDNLPYDIYGNYLLRFLKIYNLSSYFLVARKYALIGRNVKTWHYLIQRDYKFEYVGICPNIVYRMFLEEKCLQSLSSGDYTSVALNMQNALNELVFLATFIEQTSTLCQLLWMNSVRTSSVDYNFELNPRTMLCCAVLNTHVELTVRMNSVIGEINFAVCKIIILIQKERFYLLVPEFIQLLRVLKLADISKITDLSELLEFLTLKCQDLTHRLGFNKVTTRELNDMIIKTYFDQLKSITCQNLHLIEYLSITVYHKPKTTFNLMKY